MQGAPGEAAIEVHPALAEPLGLAVALLLGLILGRMGVALVERMCRDRASRSAQPGSAHPPWGAVQILGAILVFLAVAMLTAPLARGEGDLDGASPDVFGGLVATLISFVATGGYVLGVALRSPASEGGRSGFDHLGVPGPEPLRALGVGGAAYLCFAMLILAGGEAWAFALQSFGVELVPQSVLLGLLEEGPSLAMVAIAVVAVPCLEELVFRGFLLPYAVRFLGGVGGVIATSLFFAALHMTLAGFGGIFLVALLCGWLQRRTGSLAAPCVAHAAHNGWVLFLAFRYASSSPEAFVSAIP